MSTGSAHTGRRLCGAPVLLQDWDEEVEEGAAQYWELFLDLLLVAAASSIADEFKEHLSLNGFLEFAVLYLVIVNGWLLYTHHITTRFQDASLAHSFILFFYLLGFGMCIVNASFEDARGFCVGAILLRFSVLLMLANIAYCIARARYFCKVLAGICLVTIVGLSLPILFNGNEFATKFGLWMAAGVETLAEIVLSQVLVGRRLVPINIDHTKERLGALVLVMLGETVLSVTITYRELKQEQQGEAHHHSNYYWALGLSFLLMFMFTLLFFHMQPSPAEHAFHRSRMHGTLTFVAHKILGLALLSVGVSVKLVVESVMDPEDNANISPFGSHLMGYGVGAALCTLLCIRYMHYGNKKEFYVGANLLRIGRDAKLDRITSVWWWTFGVACIIPFAFVPFSTGRPLFATGFYAGLLLLVCVLETSYTDYIGKRLDECAKQEEQNSLMDTTSKSYQDVGVSG
jgi:low temperature requirement protein LtrA